MLRTKIIAGYLFLALMLAYFADWGIFVVHRSRGAGFETIEVEQYLRTPLKGSKTEYDYLGSATTTCSTTLFPQYADATWNTPCWWMRRHTAHWQ